MDLQRHATTRIRHETRRRTLTVSSTALLTPRMRRFGFTAPDLHDFVSASPDDHIKLFFLAQARMTKSPCVISRRAGSIEAWER